MADHGSRGALYMDSTKDILRTRNMHCRLRLVIICVIFIFASFHPCEAQVTDNIVDVSGLRAFAATADENGVLRQNWTSRAKVCHWLGITCDAHRRVSHLDLSSVGLNGTFQNNTLSRLRELQYLSLSNNSLHGQLPADLSNVNLESLLADNNQLSGPLPNLTMISNLQVVDLSGNKLLNGTIPDLSILKNLTTLNLSDNLFQGGVPGLPSSLVSLNLTNNQLTGQIPGNDISKFPGAFAGNPQLCGTPSNPCAAVVAPSKSPAPAPHLPPGAAPPAPSPASPPMKISSILVIALGVFGFLLFLIAYGRYFYVTRFEKPGGAFYHCYHPEDVEDAEEAVVEGKDGEGATAPSKAT